MLLTEEQARENWCPFARVALEGPDRTHEYVASANRLPSLGSRGPDVQWPDCRCVASACMAWRWVHGIRQVDGVVVRAVGSMAGSPADIALNWKGFCGLAGNPA